MHLADTLQKVRDRIAQYGAVLQQNEMLTRYTLIDPLLRALGWDTEDPEIVVPEYTTQTGRMDYVLYWNNQMYIALEAKALRGNLPGARNTGFQYCWHNKIPFYLVSDGDTWELYDMTVQGGHQLFCLQISQTTHLGQAAYDLMRLSRALMPLPTMSIPPVKPVTPATVAHTSSAVPSSPPTVASPAPQQVASTISGNPVSLASLHQQGYPVTGKRPQQIIFPDKSSAALRTWKDFLIETIKFLDRVQKLPPPPYSVGKQGKSWLYNTAPTHPDGKSMLSPNAVSTSYGVVHVETNASAMNLCQAVYNLVGTAGVNPKDVTLVLA